MNIAEHTVDVALVGLTALLFLLMALAMLFPRGRQMDGLGKALCALFAVLGTAYGLGFLAAIDVLQTPLPAWCRWGIRAVLVAAEIGVLYGMASAGAFRKES